MRVHILQHVPFEGTGSIQAWLEARHTVVSTTRLFESPALPSLNDFDMLIALGGPMSVNDELELPWLRDEKKLIREAVVSGKAVLGICLGAQLIASSLGARVYPGIKKEIGWFPIYSTQHNPMVFAFPERIEVFHWHGETFDLPAGAVHLAKSEGCLHQAFQVGERTIGLQFHLETTPECANAIVAECRHELVPDHFVQSEQDILATPANHYIRVNSLMADVLTYLVRKVTS